MNGASLLKEYVTSLDSGDIGWVRLGTAGYSMVQHTEDKFVVVGVMGFSTKLKVERQRESKAQKADQDVPARIWRKATKKTSKNQPRVAFRSH